MHDISYSTTAWRQPTFQDAPAKTNALHQNMAPVWPAILAAIPEVQWLTAFVCDAITRLLRQPARTVALKVMSP